MSELDLEKVELERPQGRIKNVYRGPGVAFVPHPHINGAWMKVHPCVVDRHCPACGVTPGALCIFTPGKHTTSHHYRRNHGPKVAQESPESAWGAGVAQINPIVVARASGAESVSPEHPSYWDLVKPGIEIPPPLVLDREDAS